MLNHIQMLRGLAASLVVFFHSMMYCRKYIGNSSLHDNYGFESFGAVGVDIFFVISGFIMVYVSYDKFSIKHAPLDYLIRRVIRVVPIYWFWTFVYVSLLLLAPALFSADLYSLQHTLLSIFFIPSVHPYTGSSTPVVAPGWTLNFEMFFYYCFALFLFFPRKYLLPGLTALLVGLSLAGLYIDTDNIIIKIFTNTLLLEFLLGCYIGTLYKSGTEISLTASYLLALVGFAWLVTTFFAGTPDFLESDRILIWGIGAAIFVMGIAFIEKKKPFHSRLLMAVGDSSYSLYLSHIFVMPLIAKSWMLMNLNTILPIESFLVISIIISIAFGHLCYLLIEKPVTGFLNSYYRKRRLI